VRVLVRVSSVFSKWGGKIKVRKKQFRLRESLMLAGRGVQVNVWGFETTVNGSDLGGSPRKPSLNLKQHRKYFILDI